MQTSLEINANGEVQCPDCGSKSVCANKTTFLYSIAEISTPLSPCSNVRIHCRYCPDSAPAAWRYNVRSHKEKKHPYIPISDYREDCRISETKRRQMKIIWDRRHKVKMQKGKKGSCPLDISMAHSLRLTPQYVLC